MPNIKSAKKRVKVSQTKQMQNKMIKSQLRNAIKKFDLSLTSNDSEKIKSDYTSAVSCIDKARLKGIIHKNTANRSKSRLAVRYGNISK